MRNGFRSTIVLSSTRVSRSGSTCPVIRIAGVSCPILILQGRTDLQVRPKDAYRLADAAPKARLVVLPRVNHVLKHAATQEEQRAAYADPARPVADEVIDTVAAFLRDREDAHR